MREVQRRGPRHIHEARISKTGVRSPKSEVEVEVKVEV